MVLALLKFFFQIMRKIMLFFENYATFFKYAFQKKKNTKQSPAVYILLMQHDIFFTLNYSLALINTTYWGHFAVCESSINESPVL